MRHVIASIFVVALAISGCDRQATPAAGQTETATPAAAATGGTPTGGAESSTLPVTPSTAAATSQAAPATVPALVPARPPVPEVTWREVTIPAGTSLPVILDTGVASDTSSVETRVEAHLTRAIVVGGVAVIPRGSQVGGVVTDATRAAKVKGRASIAMRFDTLTPEGDSEPYKIRTGTVSRLAPSTKKDDTVKILAPAVGGAIIGRIIGGRKGAAIGAGTGAGAGGAVVMSTRGKEVRLGKGAALTLKLVEPLTVRVRS